MVRGCHRHVSLLNDLLNKADEGHLVDPTLIHYSFAFCASHVHGNRPDSVGTVTLEEKEKFQEVKERLRVLLEKQITNFRSVPLLHTKSFTFAAIASRLVVPKE